MLDGSRLSRLGQGMALLFGWLFLVVSLAGYDPTDPPGSAVWEPVARSPRNPCGPVGAALAHALMAAVGGASWAVAYAALVAVLARFRRQGAADPARWAGGLFLIVASTASSPSRRPTN